MRHIFIINPAAGRRDQTARIYDMAERLRTAHGLECACLLTQRPGGGAELARRAAETGEAVRIYACGGDGTAHEAANGIAGFENAAMTCIPIGTGNDFLKNFGADADKFSDAENLWDGPQLPLDLIDCGGHLCLTIACVGVDARVAADVHRYSRGVLNGRGSYLAAAAANFLFKGIGQRWTVELDGETLTGEFALAAVCNGRYYGGGSTPIPWARMDDRVLNTIVVKNISRMTFARMFSDYSAGRCEKFREIARTFDASVIRIRAEAGILTCCVDGEIFTAPEVAIRLSDVRVNFFGPAGCDPNRTAVSAPGSFTKTS